MEGKQAANSMKTQTVHLLPDEQLEALHQQLVESQSSYHHKLQSSQEAQHRQAVLVQKLQAKVRQYRNWCKELEQRLEVSRGSHPHQWDRKEDHSLEKALVQLEEEQQRCENLAGVNILLREHLDQANEVNGALREDVSKLVADWTRARDELEYKESEWRKEREFFESYMRGERDRILGIWRQVVTLRRYFLEMKTATDRDLSELKAEQVRLSGSILVSCFRLSSDTQLWETSSLEISALRGQQQQQQQLYMKPEKMDMEKEMYQQTQAIVSLRVKGDLAREDLQSRVMELTALLEQSQKENEAKEKTVKTLRDTVETLEASRLEIEYEQSLSKDVNEEILSLQHVIQEITQAVINESDATIGSPKSANYAEPCSLFQLNPGDPDGTLLLVRDRLTKRSNDVQHLRQQLQASQNSVSSLAKQQEQQEQHCSFLRQRLEQLEGERDTLTSQLLRLQSTVETYRSDHVALEKSRKELQQQLEVLEQEARDLRQSNTELQLKGDLVDGEKEEQEQELERMLREREYIQEDRNTLEEKHSLLRNELVAMREALEKSRLDGELVKQEKHECASALEQAEQSLAKLTSTYNKLKAEAADLHDVTAKMSALNEALVMDKVELNQLILKLEQENQTLLDKVDCLERIRTSSQKQLHQTGKTNEELRAEKFRLEQSLHEAEELQDILQDELRGLRDEQKETYEKLSKAYHQHEMSSTNLEQAHQESSRLGEVLTKVSREKELLMREKAALEVRLGAVERERLTLTEQMAEFSSTKVLLESSLFQAQQQVSQLEVTTGQLEMKVQAIGQAKEVIQGEVKCLRIELEVEKSKVEQEKEEKAQQLVQAEQKYQEALNHCQIVHKEEMNTIFQELEGERERHHIELEQVSERVVKEKEEMDIVYERKLLELRQEMEAELVMARNAKQEMLLEKESERKSLLEEFLQTKKELASTCQQLEYLHQEAKKYQEKEQDTVQGLEAELKDAQSTVETLEKKYREEIKSLKEEINFLLQQQDNLQSQVQELESQLLTAKDSCQLISQEAQQRLREVQELSKQKVLEVTHLQKVLEAERKQREEMVQQNMELQSQNEEMVLRNAELRALQQSQWEEEKHLNRELQRMQEEVEHKRATLQVLERERSRWDKAERQNSERHSALQRLWEEAERQNKQLQNQTREAELQNGELRHQKEEAERQNAQLKRQQEEVARESAELQSRWEEAQRRSSELQSWKEQAEHQNAELQALFRSQREELESRNVALQTKWEEVERQNTVLQKLKEEQSQWKEMECQNAELKAALQALEQERARMAASLEEKEIRFKNLQQSDGAHQTEIAKLRTALQLAEQLLAEQRKEVQELNSQMQSLKQVMAEKEAASVTHTEQLTQDLEESCASERRVKDSVQRLEAEVSQLRLSLCNTESRADALASECQRTRLARWEAQSQLTKLHSVLQYMLCNSPEAKLEHRGQGDTNVWSSLSFSTEQDNVMGLALSQLKDFPTVERVAEAIQDLRQDLWQARLERDEMRKNSEKLKQELVENEAERDRLSAKAQELQKWLNQSLEEKNVAEGKRGSLESALKAEVIAFKEENVTLRGKMTTLEKTLESTEKQRKDVLNERDTLQMAKEKVARELNIFRESMRTSEIRANAMEKMNQSLEQELQTTLSTLRIKHNEVETLQQEAGVGRALQENLDCLTATLGKREEEIRSQLQQITDLERHRDVQNASVERLTKDLEKQGQETESQKRQIEELGKENEMKKAVLEKLNLDLEEMLQAMKSQEEKIQKLEELTQNQRTIMESLTVNLEEKMKETQVKEEKIQFLEVNESSQIGALLKDLGDLKIRLSEKDWELASQRQLLQEREEQGGKREKSLHTSLEHMKAILRDKEREVESQGEQIANLQQRETQREEHLRELHEKLKQTAFTLTQRDQELESQKLQVRDMEGEMETELRALRELTATTQQSLKEKNTELEFQTKHKEEVERQIRALLGDVQFSTAVLKERDGSAEFQKEQIKPLKEEKLQETTFNMLEQLKVVLRGKEQDIVSLKTQKEEHEEEKERVVREMQTNLQEAKQALRNGERQLESLKEENRQLQQQEEKAMAQTKSVLEKLEFTRSSLQDRDKETESLQGHIKELSGQKEEEQNKVASLQQDLARINELLTEKEEELLKQAKQIRSYEVKVEATLAELQACQSQASHLEGIIKKREQESKGDLQKLQRKHEQVKENEKLPIEKEGFLEEGHEREMKTQSERGQKQMEDEIKVLQENIQDLQYVLKKKGEEAEQLEERVRGKEKELLAYSQQVKEIISALRLQGGEEGNLQSHVQQLLMWKEEKRAQSTALQEKDQRLEWQKEKIQHLEDENRGTRQEVDRVTAVLKQTESGEIEWRERAQKLGLSLAKSEEALRALTEEMAIVQNMVSERDRDRVYLQEQLDTAFRALEEERHSTKALASEVDLLSRENMPEIRHQEAGEVMRKEGELTWLAERRCLDRRLQLLQQAVARLENDKYGLEQRNTRLRDALEQVERERRRLKRSCGDFSLSFGDSQADSGTQKIPSFAKEETQILHKQLAELQKQVSVLQKQLSLERKQKQDYIDSCAKTNRELSGLHQELSDSLAAVAREPEATILESETRKLDETLNHSLALAAAGWDGLLSGKHPISSTPKTAQQKASRR